MEEYTIIKINKKEKEVLKRILAKELFEYKKLDDKEITPENYNEENEKYRMNKICKELLYLLRYMER